MSNSDRVIASVRFTHGTPTFTVKYGGSDMSVGIVRVQKMGAGSVKGIEIHDRREKDGISHSNPDIDWERSKLNYDIHPAQNESFYRAVKERINDLHLQKAVRKDAVVMSQVLVTSDSEFFSKLTPEKTEQFFKDSYKFLCDRYGKENVISATIHMDERTPHMHFNFVPVTEDGRLSAKSILTRQNLIKQQSDFYQQVGVRYGLERGMTKEERIEKGVQRKNFTVPEYKALTAEIERKEIELAELKEKAEKASESVSKAQEMAKTIQDGITPLQAEYEAKKAYVRECDKASDISVAMPDYAKVNKSLLGKQTVTVPLEKWQEKHVSANEKSFLEKATKEFENKVSDFRHTSTATYVSQLEQKVKGLERELSDTKMENNRLKVKANEADMKCDKIIDRVNNILGKLPDDVSDRFMEQWKAEKALERGMSQGMEK